jgi:hypothetical protein
MTTKDWALIIAGIWIGQIIVKLIEGHLDR